MCPLPKLAAASQLPETMVQICAKILKEKHTYDKKLTTIYMYQRLPLYISQCM